MRRLLLSSFLCAVGVTSFASSAGASYYENLRMNAGTTEATQIRDVQTQTSTNEEMALPNGSFETILDAAPITRAQFVAMLVQAKVPQMSIDNCFWDIAPTVPPTFTLVYTDVSVDDEFAHEICAAMRDGYIRGYKDGSFQPDRLISLVEASKIVARAYALTPYADSAPYGQWYRPYMDALSVRNAIPESMRRLDQTLTAGQAKDIIRRLNDGVTWEPARSIDDLQKEYDLRNRRVAPRAPVTPAPTMIPTSVSTSSMSNTAVSSKKASVPMTKSSAATMSSAGAASSQESSREKMWYEF
jgi:hypothetical protein